jgi:hypothetical protein
VKVRGIGWVRAGPPLIGALDAVTGSFPQAISLLSVIYLVGPAVHRDGARDRQSAAREAAKLLARPPTKTLAARPRVCDSCGSLMAAIPFISRLKTSAINQPLTMVAHH